MAQSELDPRTILRSLGVADASSITPVTGGYDTAIWQVECGGQTYALRVFPPGRQGGFALEVAAMQAAAAAGMAVPHVHVTGEWQGYSAMLITWCAGQPLLAAALRRLWRTWPMAVAFGRMHARMHIETAPPLLQAYRSNWVDFHFGDLGEPALVQHLRTVPQRHDVLLHLDYHPLNVLMAGEQVSAVIDWTNAHAGDPRADVARSISILRLAPVAHGLQRLLFAPIRRLLAAGYLRGYQQVAGPLRDMAPFYAWAGVIVHKEFEPRVGHAGVTARDIAFIDRWVARWKRFMPTT